MSTKKLQLPVSGFTGGLNTEATVLSILPSEMALGTVNIDLLRNGSVRPRRGVDFFGLNTTNTYLSTIRTNPVASEPNQETPSAIAIEIATPDGNTIKRIVAFINGKLQIYKTDSSSISNFGTPFQSIDLGTHCHSQQKYYKVQFKVSDNKVFFTGRYLQPGFLTCNIDNSTLDITYLDVYIRDSTKKFITTRVAYAADGVNNVQYEALQSHPITSSPTPGTPAADKYWQVVSGPQSSGITSWTNVGAGNYVSAFLNVYPKDEVITTSTLRPSVLEFFAGCLWLGGDPKYPNTLYKSQVVTDNSSLGKMFQTADPFRTDDSTVVDTDGLTIKLQNVTLITCLSASAQSLFVGHLNGCKEIYGVDGVFAATNFAVVDILSDPVLGPNCIANSELDTIIFALNNIWKATRNTSVTVTLKTVIESISTNYIQNLYIEIGRDAKAMSTAIFNSAERKIYWFYPRPGSLYAATYGSYLQPGYLNTCIVYDTTNDKLTQEDTIKRNVSNSFTYFEYESGASLGKPYITAPFLLPSTIASVGVNNVVDQGIQVVDGVDDVIMGTTSSPGNDKNIIACIALQRSTVGSNVSINAAFAEINKPDTLKDWASDTTNAYSYPTKLFSGTSALGDLMHPKTPTYVYFLFKQVETGVLDANGFDTNPGGCLARWALQWANSANSKDYSATRQVYKPQRFDYTHTDNVDDGYSHSWYKARVYGHGNSFQLVLERDGDRDFLLIGWVIQFHQTND